MTAVARRPQGRRSEMIWSGVCALSGINLAATSAHALYSLHAQGWSYHDSLAPYSPCRYPPASAVMTHGALGTYGSIQAVLRSGSFVVQVVSQVRRGMSRHMTQSPKSPELERLGWGINCFDAGLSFAGHLYNTYLITRCNNPTLAMFAVHAALGVLAGGVIVKGALSIRLQLLALARDNGEGSQQLNRWVKAVCAPDCAVALAAIGAGLLAQGAYRLRDLQTPTSRAVPPLSLEIQQAFPPRTDVTEPTDSVWLAALVTGLGGATVLSAVVIGSQRIICACTKTLLGYLAGTVLQPERRAEIVRRLQLAPRQLIGPPPQRAAASV